MTAPRLEIDLDKIQHNARSLVERLSPRGISITGVTKATLGSPDIARTLIRGGVKSLGDSRIDNIMTMRDAGVPGPMTLLRSPMLSDVHRIVAHADVSFNTELEVIKGLSSAAQQAERIHGIVLMVELGDLREGIMPGDLENTVWETLRLPNIALRGIGANLACRNGVTPDDRNMAELSSLADSIDATFGPLVEIVSGGNSANLQWALNAASVGRINDLRLGEAILLGRETLHRRPIDGLHTDAITLVAEVIESKTKPSQPWGDIAQAAFGETPPVADRGDISQVILAIGRQDIDPSGLRGPSGITILAASSDHLIIESARGRLSVGAEIALQLNYSSLLRAMTSPFVTRVVRNEEAALSPGPLLTAEAGSARTGTRLPRSG